MNRKLISALAVSIPAAAAVAPRPASAQAIIWHVDNALALGSGCSSTAGDTEFIAAGNDVVVLFQNLDGNKNCSVRIPATVREGFYLAELTQTIIYGYHKSSNASGAITALASIFNNPVASFNIPIPVGPPNDVPVATRTRVTPILVVDACAGSLTGLYRSDLATTTAAPPNGFILLTLEGLALRYQITLAVSLCPLP